MASELYDRIEKINAHLATMLAETKRALTGERDFGVEQVRALSEPIAEMAAVMERAPELRKLHPGIAGQLDLYKAQLTELQPTIERVRMMLLARRTQMDAERSQLDAVAQWADAFSRTR